MNFSIVTEELRSIVCKYIKFEDFIGFGHKNCVYPKYLYKMLKPSMSIENKISFSTMHVKIVT